MATDDSSSSDWILLNEEDVEIQQESSLPCDDIDLGEDTVENNEVVQDIEYEDQDSLSVSEEIDVTLCKSDDESESFSILSSISDGFSYLSFIDDISLTSGIRCYMHYRNHKLNKSLDFVLTLTFTLVAGLAVGNFIGLSKNCEFEKYQLIKNCTLNQTMPFGNFLSSSPLSNGKVLDNVNQKYTDQNFIQKAYDHFAVITVSMKETSQSKQLWQNDKPVREEEKHWVMKVLPHESSHDSVDGVPCNDTEKIPKHNLPIQLPALESLQARNSQNLEPLALIQFLHGAVDEVVHRAVDLTHKIPTERFCSDEDIVYIDNTKNLINEFTHLVRKILDNLSKSLKPSQTENKPVKDKYFFKTTSNIVKAIDKIMKSIFEEVLSKKESIKSRLGKIQHVCVEIVKKLQKNLNRSEKKMDFSHNLRNKKTFNRNYHFHQKFDDKKNKVDRKYEGTDRNKYHNSRNNFGSNTYLQISHTD